MSEWQPIDTAPTMQCVLFWHEYYSHGQVRHGYFLRNGMPRGIDATGRDEDLQFRPTHWMPLPPPPTE